MAPLFKVISLLVITSLVMAQKSTPPNIIFILSDDMGWNDVSFHGSDQIPTPNIDALAFHGVVLNSHYVQPLCTPSRAALMTGKYPLRFGMQVPILEQEARGLPEATLLPQYLKELGYVARSVGKWHLGFHKRELLPTYRGFDSHFGHWGGSVGYYDFIVQTEGNNKMLNGFILWDNLTARYDLSGRYSTDVYTEAAERLIQEHDVSRPLFLYLAHQACHAGNPAASITAPPEVVARFGHIPDPNRRLYAGVVSKLDESVGRVVAALQQKGMLQNSIIVFSSDNGAPGSGKWPNWGSNYPFRGVKGTVYEGGVRSPALVWSPLLESTPRVSQQLLHITDWLPTLYAAAGGNVSSLPGDLDGVNVWEALVNGEESPRKEILLNVQEEYGNAAIRVGDWKLVKGVQMNNFDSGFSEAIDSGSAVPTPAYDPQLVLNSPAGQAVSSVLESPTSAETILRLRAQATLSCPGRPDAPLCQPASADDVCVFNVSRDLCEAGASTAPADVVALLQRRLAALSEPSVPQQAANEEPELADPARWNNTWVPWTDCLEDDSHSFCHVIANRK